MNDREIARLAGQLATGAIVEEQLAEMIGDDTIVKKIVLMASALTIVGGASSVIDDTVDSVMDVVDEVNPFNW